MRTKLLLALAFVVVACLSFYAGGEFIMRGGSFGALLGDSGQYTTVSGEIVSVDGGLLTVRNETGGTSVVLLDQETRLLRIPEPTPASVDELSSGAVVAVAVQDGVARQVQILSAPATQTNQ